MIIDQFNSLSEFAAVIERLGLYLETAEGRPLPQGRVGAGAAEGAGPQIETVEAGRLAIERLTLVTPDRRRTLVTDLSFEVAPGPDLLIMGDSGVGKTSMLRAIAGLWRVVAGLSGRPCPT